MTDPATKAALVERGICLAASLNESDDTDQHYDGKTVDLLLDLIEALQAEVAELRSWKAAEGAHHQLLRQQAKAGFAAGVEAAAKVAEGECDRPCYDGVVGEIRAIAEVPEMVAALRAWVKYDQSDMGDVSCMLNYADAMEATRAILARITQEPKP